MDCLLIEKERSIKKGAWFINISYGYFGFIQDRPTWRCPFILSQRRTSELLLAYPEPSKLQDSSHTCKQDKSSLGFFGVPINLPPERFDSFKLAVAALNEPPLSAQIQNTLSTKTLFLLLKLTHFNCCHVAMLPCCHVAMLRCCVVALLRCCVVALLRCCVVALLRCCVVALLRCCVAVLLCFCVVALLLEKTDVARRIKRSTVVEHGSHSNKETQTLVDTRFFIFTSLETIYKRYPETNLNEGRLV
ncbi:hypothetical protein K501DRAFT_276394 [Backusella circina FSU 941]|nr:hypothetical protein K501DRAFT_276394 [Backusella circina FSU 941]